jgi:predicted ATP-dependent endonuclease of OLD family
VLKSIRFESYKAFFDYTIHLSEFNILVGPNNCGKSTVIGSLRLLDMAFRKARNTRASDFYTRDGTRHQGVLVNTVAVDVSTENVSYDYTKKEPKIIFMFNDQKRAELFFLEDGDCYFSCSDGGVKVITPKQFKESFSDNLKCIPILGPLEHNEDYVTKATVLSNINTHRASRNFRSYWIHFPENWESFQKMIRDTWPGMEVEKPYLDNQNVYLMCKENRMSRELFWVGYGFQIWCQILAHISMLDDFSMVVVDEPEIYLHAEVQRQLITILRELDKQIVIATHSIEILGESNPDDVVIIEKEKEQSYRIKNIDGIQRAVSLIGSIHNITLANLARTRKMLCMENMSDYAILSKFMKVINGSTLERSSKLTPIEMEGSSFVQNVKSFAWGLKKKFDLDIDIGIIIDRDFYSNEAIQDVYSNLEGEVEFIHVLAMKEIENYLLDFDAIAKCIHLYSQKAKEMSLEELKKIVTDMFSVITDKLKNYIISQISANRLKTKMKSIDDSSEIEETLEDIEMNWIDLERRKALVPGKKVLHCLRDEIQKEYKVNVSDSKIIANINCENIHEDMKKLLGDIVKFIG